MTPCLPRHVHYQVLGHHLLVWSDRKAPLSWDLLMAVKDEALGEDATAIEVYPPRVEVVNERPIRHLWRTDLPVPSLRNPR